MQDAYEAAREATEWFWEYGGTLGEFVGGWVSAYFLAKGGEKVYEKVTEVTDPMHMSMEQYEAFVKTRMYLSGTDVARIESEQLRKLEEMYATMYQYAAELERRVS